MPPEKTILPSETCLGMMYLWHEAEMEKKRAEHEEELESMKLSQKIAIKDLKIKYELKLQKVKNEKKEHRQDKSDLKHQISQSREWINLIVTSQLTQNKRNTLLISKAAHIGIFEAKDLKEISDKMEDDDKCEELLINPLLDLISPKP